MPGGALHPAPGGPRGGYEPRESRLRGRHSEAKTAEGSRPPPTNGGGNQQNQGLSSSGGSCSGQGAGVSSNNNNNFLL
jgi:hypothetical protein